MAVNLSMPRSLRFSAVRALLLDPGGLIAIKIIKKDYNRSHVAVETLVKSAPFPGHNDHHHHEDDHQDRDHHHHENDHRDRDHHHHDQSYQERL